MKKVTTQIYNEDENDLLSDMSFTHIDHMSPFKTNKSSSMLVTHEPLKKTNTIIHNKPPQI